MKAKIKKLNGVFPVTVANAVYVDGTKKTLAEAMNDGVLGNIGKVNTFLPTVYPQYNVITTGTHGSHECTFIGSDLVSFDKYTDGGGVYWKDIENGTSVATSHHFVEPVSNVDLEMKSVDFKFEKLLVGNGRATYTVDNSKLYIFYDAPDWKTAESAVTFENCGDYDVISIEELGYKVYGFWGNADDIVFVSCNLFNDIYRIQIGRGSNNLGKGTYVSTTSDRYNGSYKILDHWHQDGAFGGLAAHGGQYYNGNLYLGVNDNTICKIVKCIWGENGSLRFEPMLFDKLLADGSDYELKYIDGMCIKDGKLYAQPIAGTGYAGKYIVAEI